MNIMELYDLTPKQIQTVLGAIHSYASNLYSKDQKNLTYDQAVVKAFDFLWELNESYWCSDWTDD